MPPKFTLMSYEVKLAARAAITALKTRGFQACLVGGAACMMYGMKHRTPNDVDIVVLTDESPETLKALIVSSDRSSSFYLRSPIDPANTYKILWYKLSYRRSCKVDILVPGILSIPQIPREYISFSLSHSHSRGGSAGDDVDIPLAPFLVVLFLKVRAWTDHRADPRQYMRDKVGMDKRDIDELLELGAGITLANSGKWLPREFLMEMWTRVVEYAKESPETVKYWKGLVGSR